ncbi:hypothetical protein HJC23_003355 [Cyclotella cryptica]|uniref:Uncharacterized protein n=1 Tax=Cyclotella cryptica TaxID=29204 RepID=A0ABD3QXX8_9STRA|eukprot:CCRYP_000922-RA/>CCRYP_000922-RA protein AED:0.19 eAED:0.19 QI:0/-1/0/1/-1/1/1/0/857
MNMRSRPSARPKPPPAPPINNVQSATADDDKKKEQAPVRKSKFRLPPPPKLSLISSLNQTSAVANKHVAANGTGFTNGVNANNGRTEAAVTIGGNEKSSIIGGSAPKDEEMGHVVTSSNAHEQLISPPPLPIPSPHHLHQTTTTSVYQRGKHNSFSKPSSTNKDSIVTIDGGSNDPTSSIHNKLHTSNSKSNITRRNNPYQSYKPSAWYANARRIQKYHRRVHHAFIGAVSILSLGLLWWYFHYEVHHPKGRHHHSHHSHHPLDTKHDDTNAKYPYDNHNHLHAMIGIVDNPAGFALYSAPIRNSQRQGQQKSWLQSASSSSSSLSNPQSPLLHPTDILAPTITLSNSRPLPRIGFAVAGHHIEHKEIPLIISRLLQYSSSESEGGGGIALIDAVDSLARFSNKKDAKEEKQEERGAERTVVALVGRAIAFFAKENHKRDTIGGGDGGVVVQAQSKSKDNSYDYENRLEVHLLVGLSDSELGIDDTWRALADISAELDGLIPPIHDVDHVQDSSSWKAAVDHRVDTRLHVLLRLPECVDNSQAVVPCSSDDGKNLQVLQRWIDSWGVLETLYEANILHGIGVDGTTERDLKLLLKHCKVVPQLYRGDVSQALDGYGRRMGVHSFDDEHHVGDLLKEENITFLASNVAGHILEKKDDTPNAYGLLQVLGKVLFRSHREMLTTQEGSSYQSITNSNDEYFTVPRLVLAYLIRHGVVALPHAYKPEHLADDAPESVGALANFLTERRVAEIGVALKALVTGRDLPEDHGLGTEDEDVVAVVFHNELDEDVTLVQIVHENNQAGVATEKGIVEKSDSAVFMGRSGDEFEVYQSDGHKLEIFQVRAENGSTHDFTISKSRKN